MNGEPRQTNPREITVPSEPVCRQEMVELLLNLDGIVNSAVLSLASQEPEVTSSIGEKIVYMTEMSALVGERSAYKGLLRILGHEEPSRGMGNQN